MNWIITFFIDIEYARRILDGFKNHTSKGIGAFVLDGKMIDQPVVRWAEVSFIFLLLFFIIDHYF